MNPSTIHAAIAGILALGVASTALAAPVTPQAGQEKCYGIAKGTCTNMGGTTEPPKM